MARKQHQRTGKIMSTEAHIYITFDHSIKRPILVIEGYDGRSTRWVIDERELEAFDKYFGR